MLDAMWWFITAQAIGLAAFPLAFYLLPSLRDRGYAFSKPLGLLVLGFAIWILSYFHGLPNTRLSLIVLLILLASASGVLVMVRRKEFLAFLSRERRTILAAEVIFLVFYIGWILYRAYDPSIDTTEKPMDFAFLNASLQTRFAPPEDPWLRGNPISYYYFGYWMMAVVAKLTAVPSNISYNIALALLPAMAATAVFGLVYNMVRSESNRWRAAILAGVMGSVLLLAISNLEGVLELIRTNGLGSQGFWQWVGIKGLDGPAVGSGWQPDEFWWWWRATRVIDTLGPNGASLDYTIQEFPFFSSLLGDLHPHSMSIPFVLLFLAFGLNLISSRSETGLRWLLRNPIYVFFMALSLGALAFINAWDIVTFAFLLVVLLFLKAYFRHGGNAGRLLMGTVPISLVVIVLAVILYIPFYNTFNTQASIPLPWDGPSTRPIHFLLIWSLFLAALAPFSLILLWRTWLKPGWIKRLLVGSFIPVFAFLAWAFLYLELGYGESSDLVARIPLVLFVAISTYITLGHARSSSSPGTVFGLALMSLGFLLLLGPELFFVSDFFGNRMNTVFKLYYQAWVLFAVAAAFGLYYWGSLIARASTWGKRLGYGWLGLFLLLLAASLYYPIASLESKGAGFGREATLDGLAYLDRSQPDEYEAIKWLKANVNADSGILEAAGSDGGTEENRRPGGDYNPLFGRISSSTGIPTVLGWFGHEHQWRGSTLPMEGRWEDVASIYQTMDQEEAKRLLEKYRIEYVYVGPRERGEYGNDGMEKFLDFMTQVFQQGEVSIYRLR